MDKKLNPAAERHASFSRRHFFRSRCRPKAGHQVICNPAEEQFASRLRVLGGERIPLRIILLVGPAHVTILVGKVTVDGHTIKN